MTNALGQTTQVTGITPGGLPTIIVDPNGVTSKLTYDARLWLTSSRTITAAGSRTTSFAHDAVGNVIRVTQPDGSYLAIGYDAAHRRVRVTDALGHRIAYTLDALGDATLTAITPAGSSKPVWQDAKAFDALGRVIAEQRGAGQTTSFAYDGNGNVITALDPLSRKTTWAVDALNRVSKVTDPAAGVTGVTYDAHDRPLRVTAPNGAVTAYNYDGFGRVLASISPDSGTTLNDYDLSDNLLKTVDGGGVITHHAYDGLNRVISTTYPNDAAEDVTYRYDQSGHGFGIGRLTGVTDAAGSLSLRYDELGNELGETRASGSVTLATRYGYDAASRIASITYPSGTEVNYGRDVMGRVTSVAAARPGDATATALIKSVTYQPFGPVNGFAYGNGIVDARSFDGDYRLTSLIEPGALKLWYAYDAADNVKAVSDGITVSNTQTFGYDALDRLTAAASNAYGSFGWTYDAAGNRLTQTLAGSTTQYGYLPGSNRLSGLSGEGGTESIVYTGAGRIKGIQPSAGKGIYLGYNQAGRLASVASDGSGVAAYSYDGFGRRFGKELPALTSLFQYDQAGHLLEETAGDGQAVTDTVYLNGVPVADIKPQSGALYYLHTDRLGTPRKATDTGRGPAWTATYAPFGVTTALAGVLTQNLRFPGQYADAETGFYQNGWRDYAPGLGRYLESDPIGLAGGVNTYAYAEGNPIRRLDRTGLYDFDDFEIDFLQGLAGISDIVTFGASNWSRNKLNTNYADPCSDAYKYGEAIGIGAGLLYGAGELRLAKAAEEAAGLGDLTVGEVGQIQNVVDAAGRPLDVVGSAARGARTATSDIDYTTANANFGNFEGLEGQLPSIDAEHGLLRGYADPNIGPSIRFEPGSNPYFVPGGPR